MKKKIICVTFLLLLLLSLAGCGSSSTGNKSETGRTEQSSPEKKENKGDKNSKVYDYPSVTAYYMENGETKTESFPLSPEHEFFSKENFSWELDLCGQAIELKDVFEIKTDVRIVNGRLTTGSDGYIVNNGTLRLGDVNNIYSNAYDEKGIVYLTFREKGIINNGEMIMENTDSVIESGVGIANSGKIAPSFEDSYYYSIHPQPVDVNGGTFLENDGEAYLGDFKIVVSGSQGIINKESGKLYLFSGSEVAVGTGTGIVNLGSIEKCSSYGDVKIIVSVEGGIGIDNSGSLCSMVDLWVNEGTSIYNRLTGVIGDPDDRFGFSCWTIVDQGNAFVNEGHFYGDISGEIKGGTFFANDGSYSGEIRVAVAKKEAYEGIMLENSPNGVWEGGIQVKVAALKNAVIFKNAGTYRGMNEEISVYTGVYYDSWEHDEYQDMIDREFGFDQSFSIDNSTIIRVEKGAVWEDAQIRLALVGSSVGTSKGIVFDGGSVYKGKAWFYISMFTNNTVGLDIESGAIMSGSLCVEGRIGLGADGDEYFVYRSLPDNFIDDALRDNCMMKNFATLPEFRFYMNSCSGNNNVGIENFGTIQSLSDAYLRVQGSSNIGLINRGSFSGGHLFVNMLGKNNKGNNVGAVNHSVMELMSVGIGDDYETYEHTVTTLMPEDATNCVGFRNEALAVLKAQNGLVASTTSTGFVAFENYGNLTAGCVQIDSRAGKAFVQGAGGYMSAEEVSVGTHGDGPTLVVGDLIDIESECTIYGYVNSGTSVEVTRVGTITADIFDITVPKGSTGINNSGNLRGRLCCLFSDVSGCTNCIRGNGGRYFTSDIYIDDKYEFVD